MHQKLKLFFLSATQSVMVLTPVGFDGRDTLNYKNCARGHKLVVGNDTCRSTYVINEVATRRFYDP